MANSVAPEQAFSLMNHIHTKMRNKLGVDKLNMLIYIYVIQRKLDRMGFHDVWFDNWLNANDTEEKDIVKFENRTAWAEYEIEMQTHLQHLRDQEQTEDVEEVYED